MHCKIAWMGIGALVLAMAPTAWAQSSAHVVTNRSHTARHSPYINRDPLTSPQRERVFTVHRRVVAPEAIVSEGLSKQPVQEHLVELVVVNTPITIDPGQNLRRPTGGIDESHYLRQAQRHARPRQARPARVVRNPHLAPGQRSRGETIMPRAIIHVPDHLKRQLSPDKSAPPIPSVPAPPQRNKHREPNLVLAE